MVSEPDAQVPALTESRNLIGGGGSENLVQRRIAELAAEHAERDDEVQNDLPRPESEPGVEVAGERGEPADSGNRVAGSPAARNVDGQPKTTGILEEVDRALSRSEAETRTDEDSVPDKQRTSTGSDVGLDGLPIEWEGDGLGERNLLYSEDPVLPDWVGKEGLRLKLRVSFVLTPEGMLTSIREDSAYTDVAASVAEALRKWRFSPAEGAKNVRGRITYNINFIQPQ